MMTFVAQADPREDLIHEAAGLAPRNPFLTVGHAAARRALGTEPWIFGLAEGGRLATACMAFLSHGRLTRSVEIPSWTGPNLLDRLFHGLLQWCQAHSISRVELNTFGSEVSRLPPWPGRSVRRARCEFVLDLDGELIRRVSSHHARNIKRAQKAGLALHRTTEAAACRQHAVLMETSLVRRKARGEDIQQSGGVPTDGSAAHRGPTTALVEYGAGELFQAVAGGRIFSSVLVLRAEKGGYYHSAGTTAEGMACGASHWLIHHIGTTLQSEGLKQFNLGGAHEEGLMRFKMGFGPARVELEAVEIQLAGPLTRVVRSCAPSLDKLIGHVRALRAWGGVRREGPRET